jgi:hypothetical protein
MEKKEPYKRVFNSSLCGLKREFESGFKSDSASKKSGKENKNEVGDIKNGKVKRKRD